MLDAQFVEHLGDLLARHHRIIDEEHVVFLTRLDTLDLTDHRLTEGVGKNLLDIDDRHQLAIGQLGNGGDVSMQPLNSPRPPAPGPSPNRRE